METANSAENPISAENPETLFALWQGMLRVREVEERIAREYSKGQMRCPTHLSIGQEATAVGVCHALRTEDPVLSTHRSHAHYLAKGGSIPAMIAELYGKETGCSRGRGGSMHLIDRSVGFMGSTAIVGNTIPIGVGLALANKLLRTQAVAVVFFGDGATEEGAYYEAVNFAAVRQLPVLFLCENNYFSVYSDLSRRQPPGRSIAGVARALGLRVDSGNGNDVGEVFSKTQLMLKELRHAGTPGLLEFFTYRWREHCGPNYDNDLGYRSEADFLEWKSRDPLACTEARLEALMPDFPARRDAATAALQQALDQAFLDAEAAAFPAPETLFHHIYQEQPFACVP